MGISRYLFVEGSIMSNIIPYPGKEQQEEAKRPLQIGYSYNEEHKCYDVQLLLGMNKTEEQAIETCHMLYDFIQMITPTGKSN